MTVKTVKIVDIGLDKEFIKEAKKELRNKNNEYCGTYIRIDIENKLIMFSFNRYNNNKYSEDKETKIVLKDNIKLNGDNIKCIHLHNIHFNDVLLDVLLSEKIYIECYKNNIGKLINIDTDTETYMSTIIISNGKKSAKYSTICNRYCDMIVY